MTAITKHVIPMDLERCMVVPNQAGVKREDDAGSEGRIDSRLPKQALRREEGRRSPARYDEASVAVGPWRSWERV